MSTQELYEFHLQRARHYAYRIAEEGTSGNLIGLWSMHLTTALELSNKSGKPELSLA